MSEEKICIRDHRKPGWFWAANEVIDVYGPRIGPYGIAVYMALARHASERSQSAWPSLTRLTELLATGRDQVVNAVASLEAEGLIQVIRTSGQVNVYVLLDVPAGGAAAARVAEGTRPAPGRDQSRCGTGTSPAAGLEQNKGNDTQRTTQHGCVVSPSPFSELLSVGVAEATADELARSCTPGRVREVLDALARERGVANRAGWVVSALREGWDVSGPDASAPAAAAFRGQVVNCAFRRTPAMGQCPSEEEQEAWMPWCRGCERCPGGPRPPGNEK